MRLKPLSKRNPRYANGHKRRQIREWLLRTQDTCAICGRPIDKTLRTPHPLSAEVDEIIPVSKGGSPIDRKNVQLVHRCCNIAKSNKLPSEMGQTSSVRPADEQIITSRQW